MEYFRKNRTKIFPDIKDWTDPQDKYRYSNKIKEMDYKHWFYLTPSAYLLISFGINVIAVLFFGILSVYTIIKGLFFLSIMPLIVLISNILAIFRKMKNFDDMKTTTFYDIWMRDYNVGGKKNGNDRE